VFHKGQMIYISGGKPLYSVGSGEAAGGLLSAKIL
jgi:hypothetical protein